jgi:hypothetical protein
MKNLGIVEIITFRATRDEHPYIDSLFALLRGTSTGHIALRLRFSDTELYNKYVRNNDKLPHRIYLDPMDHKPVYEVYVSFWPNGSWTPWHHVSTLKSYHFDCEQSAGYSAFEYDLKMSEYLKPIKRLVVSQIPGLNYLGYSTITLPPSIIMHTSRLGIAFGDKATMIPNAAIMAKAEAYAKCYRAWRGAVVNEENLRISQPDNLDLHTECAQHTQNLNSQLIESQNELCTAMYPNEILTSEEFYTKIEPFVTYGYPERDIISLPLSKQNNTPGLEIEPMLMYISNILKYPNSFPYHVLGNNCARIIYEILWQGCKYSQFKQLTKILLLPWFIRLLKLTITPAFLIRRLANLQVALECLKSKNQAMDPQPESIVAERRKKSKIDLCIEPKQKELIFSKPSSYTEDEEIPTDKLGIYSRELENVTQYLRH